MTTSTAPRSADLERAAEGIRYLSQRADEQPALAEAAAWVDLSPTHFQRVFQRCVGLSPKRFLQHLTSEHAKDLLRDSATVLDAAFGSGLSGPGRLHDHLVTLEALTPGEVRTGGAGVTVKHGIAASPLGACFVAWTSRGVCRVELLDDDGEAAEGRLASDWPAADLLADFAGAGDLARSIFSPDDRQRGELRCLVRGTNFQVQVWRALLRIPAGTAVSYGDLARRLDRPRAHRAVGSAVARNALAVLIPCHRVLRSDGALGGYRWGTDRKRALLALEVGRA